MNPGSKLKHPSEGGCTIFPYFLGCCFPNIPSADTVTSPPWLKRREHSSLPLGSRDFKVLQPCFKTTMPSLICPPFSWVPSGSCGAHWPSQQFLHHFRQYASAGRNQSEPHPDFSGLTNRMMTVIDNNSFACLTLEFPSLGNGTSNLLQVPVHVTWEGLWPRASQLKYNDFSTASSQVTQGLTHWSKGLSPSAFLWFEGSYSKNTGWSGGSKKIRKRTRKLIKEQSRTVEQEWESRSKKDWGMGVGGERAGPWFATYLGQPTAGVSRYIRQ